jgi:Helicase HerA, central domain
MGNTKQVKPWVRIFILFLAVAVISFLAKKITGSFIPEDPFENMIFQGALFMVVFGSTVQEFFYTSPAESMVNSFMGMITLLPVYRVSNKYLWWIFFGYCTLIFILGVLCTGLSNSKEMPENQKNILEKIYHPVVIFGRARILYSILFLFGLISFYDYQSLAFLYLLLFWGGFIIIWPLGLPALLSRLFGEKKNKRKIGEIIRTDWPNIIHIELKNDVQWKPDSPKLFQEANGNQCLTVPLYEQHQGEKVIGTGIYVHSPIEKIEGFESGNIYEYPETILFEEVDINQALGGKSSSKLIGFITTDSEIPEIRFEVMNPQLCKEGMLVWCPTFGETVYYQILNGNTNEESFQSNRYGFQIGTARQLGKLTDQGFESYAWLPEINTPVFTENKDFGKETQLIDKENDFIFGKIPNTEIEVGGNFIKNMEYHTAILGVTGSGKTELGLDIIRHTAEKGRKVICIDLTMKYDGALENHNPINLTISDEDSIKLDSLLFDVEIGTYSKTEEKKALKNFMAKARKHIQEKISGFIENKESNIGIISLRELSNTQATLYITEVYLTELLNYAKAHPEMDKVLVVVEEAHTVMPEPSTMGLGDFDSKGLVGKIAQLALQGRKFGIGLLVIAQRTATVSKSILTQCNTIISFNCFDDTSLNFLKNTFGSIYVKTIPQLPKLHALIFGKAFKSQKPLIIEIPFDENKVNNNN